MIRRMEISKTEVSETSGIKTQNFFKLTQLDIVGACSADPERPELQGVILNFRDRVAVATDGCIIVQVPMDSPDELASFEDVMVPKAFFKYLKDLASSSQPIQVELEFAKKMVFVRTALSDVGFGYVRQPIPDYRQVTFKVENPTTIMLNPELLLRMRNAAGIPFEGVMLTFNSQQYDSPMTVKVGGRIIGAIMPMTIREGIEATHD